MPRSELGEAVRELSRFEWFHPIPPESRKPDPAVDEISSRLYRMYIDLEEVVRSQELQLMPGVMEILRSGYRIEKKEFSVSDWKEFLERLETEARPVVEEFKKLLTEVSNLEKELEQTVTTTSALRLVSSLSFDLESLRKWKRISAVFATVSTKDLREVRNSLREAMIIHEPLTRTEYAVLIISTAQDYTKTEKVLRTFEIEPFSVPPELSQNPAEAYRQASERVALLEKRYEEASANLKKHRSANADRLLFHHELARSGYEILDKVRRAGELKRFGILNGFLPAEMEGRFRESFGRWICVVQAAPALAPHHEPEHREGKAEEGKAEGRDHLRPPTLFRNRGYFGAFENITVNQGPPSYHEIDPTLMISLVFPIFYGMMFGDLGHGLILLIFGLYLYSRGNSGLKRWALIFSAGGVSAAIVGVLVGEFFGLPIKFLIPSLARFEQLELVNPELHRLETGNVMVLLGVAIVLGIVHISSGHVLSILNSLKNRELPEVLAEKLPQLIFYIFGTIFALGVIGVEFKFSEMWTSQEPAALLTFMTASDAAKIGLTVALPFLIIRCVGKAIAIKAGKIQGSFGESLMMAPIEFLEVISASLANSISYARLGILLVVHASLLLATNLAWSMGAAGIPVIVIANIGIIALEGLVVYIQALRLHIYEWFTKFYDGSGEEFRKITPEPVRVRISWRVPTSTK